MATLLSDTAIKSAKPQEKPYKLFDTKGLFVLIQNFGDSALIDRNAYP